MNGLLILLIGILIVALACWRLWPDVLLTPQLGFSLCFLPGILVGFFFVKRWKMQLSPTTVVVILGGVLVFFVVSLMISLTYSRGTLGRHAYPWADRFRPAEPGYIRVEEWKLVLFALIQLLVLALQILYFRTLDMGGISYAIGYFRRNNLLHGLEMPGWLINLRAVMCASTFFWLYILIRNRVYGLRSGSLLLAANVALGMANSLVVGSRTELFQIFVAGVVQLYFVAREKNGWQSTAAQKRKRVKIIVIVAALAVALVLSFKLIGDAMGRDTRWSYYDYMGMYFSAELKNLDTFIRATPDRVNTSLGNNQTLIAVVNWLAPRLRHPELVHGLDIPFRTINRLSLGNVYTTFYSFYYDGGLPGVALFTAVMAAVSQLAFLWAYRPARHPGRVRMGVIVYSYVYFTIVFSFFSNKFYEQLFNVTFLKYLLFWWVLRFYVENVRLDSQYGMSIDFGAGRLHI